jgi:hypothetical protein
MKLESARSLKAELLNPVAAPAGIGIVAAAAAAPAVSRCAIGIVPGKKNSYKLAVRVARKSEVNSPEVERIRHRAKNEIELRVTGRIRPQVSLWPRKRFRPALAGTSVGHVDITAGTLGYFARRGDTLGFISNNHVLANTNAGKVGDIIVQPGPLDRKADGDDAIGFLEHFVPLRESGANFIDCAFARFDDEHVPEQFDLAIRDIGRLTGINEDVDAGMVVRKYGRTTALTKGKITAVELDNVLIGFDVGDLRFDDQIEIEGSGTTAFSQGGDSGSIIVDSKRRAIGLLFAGGSEGGKNGKGLTYACPITPVLEALGCELLD